MSILLPTRESTVVTNYLKTKTLNDGKTINEGDEIYSVRLIPQCGICEMEILHIHGLHDKYFIGTTTDGSKQSRVIGVDAYNKTYFLNMFDCKKKIKEIKKSGIIQKVHHDESLLNE